MYDKDLAAHINQQLAGLFDIKETRMFIGIDFMLNSNMCLAIWKSFLVLRLGKDGAAMLTAHDPHASIFDLTGKALGHWRKIAPGKLLKNSHLQAYVEMADLFTGSLPHKPEKQKNPIS